MNYKLKLLVAPICLLMAACSITTESGSNSGNGPDAPPPGIDPKVLLQSDLRDLETLSQVPPTVASSNFNAFQSVFGGNNGPSLKNYLNQRLKIYLSQSELDDYDISPSEFVYDGWTKNMQGPVRDVGGSKAQVGAANIGTELWYHSLLDKVPVFLIKKDGTGRTQFSTSRAGVVLLGPGYKDAEVIGSKVYKIPAAYRQAILLHEARHSDCTGGITEKDLDIARAASSAVEFDKNFKRKQCGHLHTICPTWHDFAGLAACDDHPWGSYSIGGVYSASIAKVETSELSRRIMEAAAVDSLGRMIGFDSDKMVRGELGAPDMSSGGLQ